MIAITSIKSKDNSREQADAKERAAAWRHENEATLIYLIELLRQAASIEDHISLENWAKTFRGLASQIDRYLN
jgi:hypothetical protein